MDVSRIRAEERGGIVVGWLLKLVLVLAIVGILAYDVISIAYGRVLATDDARSIARAASDAMILNRADAKEAVQIGQQRADARGVELKSGGITVAKDGSVTVVVHREVPTLVTYRIGPLTKYTIIDESYSTPAIR